MYIVWMRGQGRTSHKDHSCHLGMTKLLLQFSDDRSSVLSAEIHYGSNTLPPFHLRCLLLTYTFPNHSGQCFSWPLQAVTGRGSSIASEKNNKEVWPGNKEGARDTHTQANGQTSREDV
ncbi:hypothetical protein CBL_00216 [Carabus blaptoides fortunei]